MHWLGHFKTVTKHRHEVMKNCFRAGIGFQGLFHDLSKYSPTEFIPGAKYWTGEHSPIRDERREKGMSLAWMHHMGRNKHHYEYWRDLDTKVNAYRPVPIPDRYIKEMFCDRVAASKVYLKKEYTDASPLAYLKRREEGFWDIHPESGRKLTALLAMLAEKGEEETFRYLKENRTLEEL